MKNFRKAALAIATAASVTVAGTTVANAEEPNTPALSQESDSATGSSNFLHKLGLTWDADTPITGEALFGSSQAEDQTAASKLWVYGTYALVAGAIAGLIIGGINQLKNMGLI